MGQANDRFRELSIGAIDVISLLATVITLNKDGIRIRLVDSRVAQWPDEKRWDVPSKLLERYGQSSL